MSITSLKNSMIFSKLMLLRIAITTLLQTFVGYTLPGQKYSYSNNFNSYIQASRGIITFVAASLWTFA